MPYFTLLRMKQTQFTSVNIIMNYSLLSHVRDTATTARDDRIKGGRCVLCLAGEEVGNGIHTQLGDHPSIIREHLDLVQRHCG